MNHSTTKPYFCSNHSKDNSFYILRDYSVVIHPIIKQIDSHK